MADILSFLLFLSLLLLPECTRGIPIVDPPLNSTSAIKSNSTSSTPALFKTLTNYLIDHRVDGTSVSLTINVRTNFPIEPAKLERTFVQTQVRLRRYIATHYRAEEDVLFPRDNPYLSNAQLTGCFVGVSTYPPNEPKRLTYGMLEAALRGMFDVLWREERYLSADFYIRDDTHGTVGIGRVAREAAGARIAIAALSKHSMSGFAR